MLDSLASLFTLTVLEVVLSIDNLVVIAVLVGKLPQDQQARARYIGMTLALVPRLSEWSVRERRACVALMRAKGGDEARYFVLARRHRRFREAMIAIAAAEASCAQ